MHPKLQFDGVLGRGKSTGQRQNNMRSAVQKKRGWLPVSLLEHRPSIIQIFSIDPYPSLCTNHTFVSQLPFPKSTTFLYHTEIDTSVEVLKTHHPTPLIYIL